MSRIANLKFLDSKTKIGSKFDKAINYSMIEKLIVLGLGKLYWTYY